MAISYVSYHLGGHAVQFCDDCLSDLLPSMLLLSLCSNLVQKFEEGLSQYRIASDPFARYVLCPRSADTVPRRSDKAFSKVLAVKASNFELNIMNEEA